MAERRRILFSPDAHVGRTTPRSQQPHPVDISPRGRSTIGKSAFDKPAAFGSDILVRQRDLRGPLIVDPARAQRLGANRYQPPLAPPPPKSPPPPEYPPPPENPPPPEKPPQDEPPQFEPPVYHQGMPVRCWAYRVMRM